MSTSCPMCGHEVRVVSGDEGTSHYEPVEEDVPATERWTRLTGERSAGAEAGWQRAVAYIRSAVAQYPHLAWPGEIDDILDSAADGGDTASEGTDR